MSRTSLTESPEVLATKSRIAASTLKEVRKHGILGLRLADVADGANVSIPLIYKYFDDRDGLLAAVLGEIIERHFAEELDSIHQLMEMLSKSTKLEDIAALMPKPGDTWRRERRWLRVEAKAAAREIPALRAQIATAMANVEQATTLLIEKARSISGNQSKVPHEPSLG